MEGHSKLLLPIFKVLIVFRSTVVLSKPSISRHSSRSVGTFLRQGHGRYYPGLSLLCELAVFPHIVCDRDRGCLCDNREGDDDMEEKDEPVNRDIDQRDDPRLSETEEEWSPENGNRHGEVETCLRDALNATSNTRLSNLGEVIERNAHYGDAEDNVQVH